MEFTAEDLKQIQNLGAILKRATFKDLTGGEVLSVALSVQWISELKLKIEESLTPKSSSVTPDVPASITKKREKR